MCQHVEESDISLNRIQVAKNIYEFGGLLGQLLYEKHRYTTKAREKHDE